MDPEIDLLINAKPDIQIFPSPTEECRTLLDISFCRSFYVQQEINSNLLKVLKIVKN